MAKKKRRYNPYSKKRYNKTNTPKSYSKDSRNYKSPEYTKWREDIKKRDNYQCQWPGCCSRHRIQIHHIKTWASYPGMRYVTANGITLCKKCHDSVKGKEVEYETFFMKILEWQMLDKIKKYNNGK
jgi:5-methylcytosine-specific restriction endonuclease McrA